ncbi:MAG: hypothetical protein JXL81_11270 [Deltaproteobacteria bacterium]|nr:hypothetical protein [Deltaproteobacteria bacterium]
MKVMGKYCKAYHLGDMRKFRKWKENSQNARIEKKEVDGKEIKGPRKLTDDSIVYLQENYFVTDDIYKEENILFDVVNPKWEDFCTNKLGFEIPDYDS